MEINSHAWYERCALLYLFGYFCVGDHCVRAIQCGLSGTVALGGNGFVGLQGH